MRLISIKPPAIGSIPCKSAGLLERPNDAGVLKLRDGTGEGHRLEVGPGRNKEKGMLTGPS
jgi:hypothetical protein